MPQATVWTPTPSLAGPDCANHVEAAMDQVFIGAHLIVTRLGYTHHGIYIGAGKVVHYAGLARVMSRGPVEEVPLAEFADGGTVTIKVEPSARYCPKAIVERARSRLGEDRYRLVTNNCEHFCAWCVTGESRSEQVERALALPRAFGRALVALISILPRDPSVQRDAPTSTGFAAA
jgi:hypothetical protein